MTEPKELINHFYKEVLSNRNIDMIDELAREDFIEHEPPPPGIELEPGRAGMKALMAQWLDAFNPFEVDVHETYQDGDTVVVRATFKVNYVNDLAGLPPATGQRLEFDVIDIVRFQDGLAAEHWGMTDNMAMLGQLGVLEG